MELWDLYDKHGNKLNKTHIRDNPFNNNDEYHIVVNVWIKNDMDQILLTQRDPQKPWPKKWECTGGSVIEGEDSYNGAIREVEEEIGINLRGKIGKKILRRIEKGTHSIRDVWLFNENIILEETKLQEGEVINIKWVTKDELKKLFEMDEMVDILEYVIKLIEEKIM
jgi:isopentenyldiphosphate isomerase